MKNSYSAASVASRHLPGGQKLPFINSLSGWLLLKDALIPCRCACLKTVIWSFRRLMISNGRSRNIWKSVLSRHRPKEKISSTSLYRRNLAIIGRGAVLLLHQLDRRCTRWISTLRPLGYPRSLSMKLLRTCSVSSSRASGILKNLIFSLLE